MTQPDPEPYRYVDEDGFCLSARLLPDLDSGGTTDMLSITIEGSDEPQSAHVPVGDVSAVLSGISRATGQQPATVLPAPDQQAAEKHRLALSQALDLGTGAPWDAIHERVAELRRLAGEAQQDEAPQPVCVECGHLKAVHVEGEDPVTPGVCTVCDPDDGHHDYEAPQPSHDSEQQQAAEYARAFTIPPSPETGAYIHDRLAAREAQRQQAHAEGEHCFCGPDCGEQQDTTEDGGEPEMIRSRFIGKPGLATVDPAMCPRCKGDNSEAFGLCAQCAPALGSGQPETDGEA